MATYVHGDNVLIRFARLQGRNHVFKVGGLQFLGLGYYTKQNTDDIPSFVHCSLQLRKTLGVVRPNFGGSGPSP